MKGKWILKFIIMIKKIATTTEYTEKIETKIRKNNVISYTY
jgi:hypothetical protein